MSDHPHEAEEGARERLAVLDDAERIVNKVYFIRCTNPGWLDCPKCRLLDRVMARINEEQNELLTALAREPQG